MNRVVGKARKRAASACNDRLNLVGRRKLLNAREGVVNSIWGKHVGIENKGIKRVEKRRWGLTAFQEKACQGRAFQTEAFRGKANVLQGTAFSTPLPETPLPDTLFPNTLLPDTRSLKRVCILHFYVDQRDRILGTRQRIETWSFVLRRPHR